jgi:GH18 family chitinase
MYTGLTKRKRYCGVDNEHCVGQPKPDRPSCDSKSSPIRRVVGYFEGWASRRPCKQFFPENVPVGVYSHLNFAFASVDPGTFAIVPADPADVELYKSLTAMKSMDPQLKVYIAIGGWAFNDPGPTANVFSQLAASESNQKAFFKSLISFMETYGFDGVDIDWEYPAADDRFGKPEDFANFPKFIENLNKAVKSTSRDGLTITLPVAYWYLRHFDIKKLQPHVDWFNLMSYDLHGSWDKENKWIGNYLNSHTNLTEITEYFDLMWRNDINPDKVVMGLGFYSRTFKPSDPGCTDACSKPKTDADCCKFSTVGDRGPCTHEYGVLSNGEIDEVLKETGATPKLDQEAAVQIVKVNGEWITYDNVDSWKLKVAFARSECLGGVMVWAVSLDETDGTYSKQLQQATGFQSKGTTLVNDTSGGGGGGGGGGGKQVVGPDDFQLRAQCFWTDCGAPCPSDYVGRNRADSDGSGEIMLDSTACQKGIRTLCCPVPKASGASLPTCGWYDFNNGACGKNDASLCGDGWAEVGSYAGACRQGWQVACCTTDVDTISTAVYGSCEWRKGSKYGDPGKCVDGVDYTACENNGLLTYNQVDSRGGTGAHQCFTWDRSGGFFLFKHFGQQSYCCADRQVQQRVRRWDNCGWLTSIKESDGYCHAACPSGTVKVAMLDYGAQTDYGGTWKSGCKSGYQVYCCEGLYKTPTTPEEISGPFEEALNVVLKNPDYECPYANTKQKRGAETTTDLALRDNVKRDMIPLQACNVVADNMVKWLGQRLNGPNVIQGYENAWKNTVPKQYSHLSVDYMEQQMGPYFDILDQTGDGYEARSFENSLQAQDASAEFESSSQIDVDLCDFATFYAIGGYPDEDDGGTDNGPGIDYTYGEDDQNSNVGSITKVKRNALASPPSVVNVDSKAADNSAAYLAARRQQQEEEEEFERHLALIFSSEYDSDEDPAAPPSTPRNATLFDDDEYDDEDEDEEAREERRWLAKRDGSPREFFSKKGTGNQVRMVSSKYPNGNNGDELLGLNKDTHRYMIQAKTVNGWYCRPTFHKLVTNAAKSKTSDHWVTEHILELQTIPRFVDFLITHTWPAVRNAPIGLKQSTQAIDISVADIQRYMADVRWNSWASIDADHAATSPLDMMLRALGSFNSLDTMVVCDSDLNGIKAQVYHFARPSSVRKFNACCTGTSVLAARGALTRLATTAGVFDYYADSGVESRHKAAYDKVKKILNEFETAYQKETGKKLSVSMAELWKTYLTEHLSRVVTFAGWWMTDRATLLEPIWTNQCQNAKTAKDKDFACRMSAIVKGYRSGTQYRPKFNARNVFT